MLKKSLSTLGRTQPSHKGKSSPNSLNRSLKELKAKNHRKCPKHKKLTNLRISLNTKIWDSKQEIKLIKLKFKKLALIYQTVEGFPLKREAKCIQQIGGMRG